MQFFACSAKAGQHAFSRSSWSKTLVCWNTSFVFNGVFVKISDHGEMGRESTWPINFSRDAREMLNDSCEIKCRNSVLLLPSSRWLAKAKARGHVSLSLEYLPSFWQALALGLPEAEVVSGSLCSKATDGLIICQLLQIFFKISYREYFVSLFCLWFCRNNGPGLKRCWSPVLLRVRGWSHVTSPSSTASNSDLVLCLSKCQARKTYNSVYLS